jgi:uncharacterized protein DUF4437
MLRLRTLGVILTAAACAGGLSSVALAKGDGQGAAKAKGPVVKQAPAKPAAAAHTATTAADLKWGPGPDSLPPGAQMAVVDGDPGKAGGAFTIRAKLPDGYKVPPHFHPTDENVTVLSGSLSLGMGDKWDEASMKALGTHGFARLPKGMHHYAGARGATEIQIHGVGPFGVTYVNKADDPRTKK